VAIRRPGEKLLRIAEQADTPSSPKLFADCSRRALGIAGDDWVRLGMPFLSTVSKILVFTGSDFDLHKLDVAGSIPVVRSIDSSTMATGTARPTSRLLVYSIDLTQRSSLAK
jgi:hypothetical protein